jgi:hypothetical protein
VKGLDMEGLFNALVKYRELFSVRLSANFFVIYEFISEHLGLGDEFL